jgi:hypothetical protein
MVKWLALNSSFTSREDSPVHTIGNDLLKKVPTAPWRENNASGRLEQLRNVIIEIIVIIEM